MHYLKEHVPFFYKCSQYKRRLGVDQLRRLPREYSKHKINRLQHGLRIAGSNKADRIFIFPHPANRPELPDNCIHNCL